MEDTRRIKKVPFLYYVKDGVCKSTKEMPESTRAFQGWFCASFVIKNPSKHKSKDVLACLAGLRDFVKNLKSNQYIIEVLQDVELLDYL